QAKTYPGNQLLLHFHSDSRDNFRGWQLVYQASPSAIPEIGSGLTVYPNPVSYYLFIDYPNQNSSNIYYRIYHPNGNIMDSGQAGSHIDLSTFAPGIYYLFIVLDQTIVTKKILKL
ncbi:T9SS type A sorting domain-containing protein, partial [Candidatus Falkowbacteria bacterium]|nr:T9SS type A sorting domain-containing protein [Candidatus Falkowbacteria bacterium]